MIVTKGIKKISKKCHTLLSLSFFILIEKAINAPIINGAISAKPSNNHLVLNSRVINFPLSNTTKSKRTAVITEPVILLFLVLVILKLFIKKFFMSLKNCETVFVTFAEFILSILSNKVD